MLGHEHQKGLWMLSYRYMHTFSQGNVVEAHPVDENYVFNNYLMSPDNMQMDMHMFMAMYGFTDKLSIMIMFNYNLMSMGMNMLPGSRHVHGSATSTHDESSDMGMFSKGIADTELYAMYKLFGKKKQNGFLHAGVTIPTGNSNVKGKADDMMYPSSRFPYAMQLGSGTVDFMPGATYKINYKRVQLGVQATGIIRPFKNSSGYNLGDKLSLNFWGAYKWLNWLSNSIRVEDIYASTIHGKDPLLSMVIEPAGNPINYGGQNVNMYAGLNIYFNRYILKNSKLLLEYGIPVYQYANGVQQEFKYGLYGSWYILF